MSIGKEENMESIFLTQIPTGDYENLCRIDIPRLEDNSSGDQSMLHSKFLEQLERSPEGIKRAFLEGRKSQTVKNAYTTT